MIYSASNGVQSGELQTLLLDSPLPTTATLDSCTCVVVKPHAVKSKAFGERVCVCILVRIVSVFVLMCNANRNECCCSTMDTIFTNHLHTH